MPAARLPPGLYSGEDTAAGQKVSESDTFSPRRPKQEPPTPRFLSPAIHLLPRVAQRRLNMFPPVISIVKMLV